MPGTEYLYQLRVSGREDVVKAILEVGKHGQDSAKAYADAYKKAADEVAAATKRAADAARFSGFDSDAARREELIRSLREKKQFEADAAKAAADALRKEQEDWSRSWRDRVLAATSGLDEMNASAQRSHGVVARVGGAFQSIANDVDAVGGAGSRVFSKWIGDASSIAIALGTGGVLGAVTALSIGVGHVVDWWNESEEATARAAEAAKRSAEEQTAVFEEMVRAQRALRIGVQREDQNEAKDRINAQRKLLEQLTREINENRAQVVAVRRTDAERAEQMDAEFEAKRAERRKLLADNELAEKKYYANEAVLMAQEARQREAEEGAEAAKKLEEQQQKALASLQTFFEEGVASAGTRLFAVMAEALGAELTPALEADANALRQRDEAQQQGNLTTQEYLELLKEVEAATRADAAAHEQKAQKQLEAAAATRAHVREMELQLTAQQRVAAGQIYGMSVNTAYGVSMFGVSAALDFTTESARAFGAVNRENYRDLLEINGNTIAAFAARTQAFLFNLGVEAGKKSIFESAEATKEMALAVGSFALKDYASGAMHLASAGMHSASGAAYAAIGGGAVGASLAIGSQRGAGGLVGLTEDERRQRNGDGGGTIGAGSGRSVSGGVGGGRSSEAPSQTSTFVYMPGAVDAGNNRHLRQTWARGRRAAADDGFLLPYAA